jgi:hypothetical protein
MPELETLLVLIEIVSRLRSRQLVAKKNWNSCRANSHFLSAYHRPETAMKIREGLWLIRTATTQLMFFFFHFSVFFGLPVGIDFCSPLVLLPIPFFSLLSAFTFTRPLWLTGVLDTIPLLSFVHLFRFGDSCFCAFFPFGC